MKLFSCTILLAMAAMFMLSGCTLDTPAYSAKERFAQISRDQYYNAEQFNDDVDYVLLLRPSSQLTIWNVWHRN